MKIVLLNLIKSVGLKAGGLAGWVLGLFIDRALIMLKDWVLEMKAESELKKKDEKLLVEYQAIVAASPTLTRKERREAALRLLNRSDS